MYNRVGHAGCGAFKELLQRILHELDINQREF